MKPTFRQGNYCLGLDIGTNSIGWAVLGLDDEGNANSIKRIGVRLFPDGRNPKDKQSLAVMRRGPRQARRRRDRYLKRRGRLLSTLVAFGLLPENEAERKACERWNPFPLRKKGLDEALSPHELGRALFHLNQRRGFRSNRKTDPADDKEQGKINSAIATLRAKLTERGARTLGEYLYERNLQKLTVRARLNGEGVKATYELYLHRDMIADEFDQLWQAQQRFHPQLLTDDKRATLRDIILFQRPLKPVDPGRCSFHPEEHRLSLAHPVGQQLRIYQELNHLRVAPPGQPQRSLTLVERDAIASQLMTRKDVSFTAIRKVIGDRNAELNLESAKREKLKGNETAVILSHAERFGEHWHSLALDEQADVIHLLQSVEDSRDLIAQLCTRYGLSMDAANQVANSRLPEGFGRIGLTAGMAILNALKADVITYDKACRAAGYSHTGEYSGEVHPHLPYYGVALPHYIGKGTGNPGDADEVRLGRIANPTVHIGLNQLRRIVNAVIARFGHPREIAVEVTRDLKLGAEKKKELEKEQAENQKRNEDFRAEISAAGYVPTGEAMQRMRLWYGLGSNPLERRCVYSGEHISIERLLSPEGGIEIDHILPFSRTLDDGMSNKILCVRRANRDKREQTPFEAFGHSPDDYDWQAILARAQALPYHSRKRFAPDAMQQYSGEQDFLARHLTDTAYLSRVAAEYLSLVCPPARIRRNPGKLTALLRGKWGLNRLLSDRDSKNRSDQRHHAIDAIVVGVTTRRMLQQVATASARGRAQGVTRLIEEMPEPWPQFHADVKDALRLVVVSYKPDHGAAAALHNDTAYGIVETRADGKSLVHHRVPVESLAKSADIDAVVDPALRACLHAATETCSNAKAYKEALSRFREATGIRRVRIAEVMKVIPIKNHQGDAYKAYKGDGNYCYEIFRDERGRWDGDVISSFTANQKDYRAYAQDRPRFLTRAFNGKPLVMRLIKDDIVAIEEEGQRRLMRVAMISEGQIALAEHHEGGNLRERDRSDDDGFRYLYKTPSSLKKMNARRAFIDELGYVKDPGFRP